MRHIKERRLVAALVAFGILAGVAPGRAQAYHIPPVTLWDLVKQANTIVLATVENEGSIDRGLGDTNWNDTVALLSVQEIWQGKAAGRIQVPYPRGMICPAPPRYEAGLIVLAFLTHDPKGARETVPVVRHPVPGAWRGAGVPRARAAGVRSPVDRERGRPGARAG
jgi:hypothetical protein